MNKKVLYLLLCIFIISVFLLAGCRNDSLVYQNQFLKPFDIDFISSEYQEKEGYLETDRLVSYIFIELNETEKEQMESLVTSKSHFYDITEYSSDYSILMDTLENDFSEEIVSIENGYFSVYNDFNQELVSMAETDFQYMDMDYYTALIYDSDNSIIYLFRYEI